MSPYESARQTLLILTPELLILLVATTMMTAGAFIRLPRRTAPPDFPGPTCSAASMKSMCFAVFFVVFAKKPARSMPFAWDLNGKPLV